MMRDYTYYADGTRPEPSADASRGPFSKRIATEQPVLPGGSHSEAKDSTVQDFAETRTSTTSTSTVATVPMSGAAVGVYPNPIEYGPKQAIENPMYLPLNVNPPHGEMGPEKDTVITTDTLGMKLVHKNGIPINRQLSIDKGYMQYQTAARLLYTWRENPHGIRFFDHHPADVSPGFIYFYKAAGNKFNSKNVKPPYKTRRITFGGAQRKCVAKGSGVDHFEVTISPTLKLIGKVTFGPKALSVRRWGLVNQDRSMPDLIQIRASSSCVLKKTTHDKVAKNTYGMDKLSAPMTGAQESMPYLHGAHTTAAANDLAGYGQKSILLIPSQAINGSYTQTPGSLVQSPMATYPHADGQYMLSQNQYAHPGMQFSDQPMDPRTVVQPRDGQFHGHEHALDPPGNTLPTYGTQPDPNQGKHMSPHDTGDIYHTADRNRVYSLTNDMTAVGMRPRQNNVLVESFAMAFLNQMRDGTGNPQQDLK
eukprot:Clim_evm233s157 gene=Clim_evmTU233s157